MSSNIDFGGLCLTSLGCLVLPPYKASAIRFTALSTSDNFLGFVGRALGCSTTGGASHVSRVLPLPLQLLHFHLRVVALSASFHRVSKQYILILHVGHFIEHSELSAQVDTVCGTYLVYLIYHFFDRCVG